MVIQEKICKFVDFSSIYRTISSTWKQTFAVGNTLEVTLYTIEQYSLDDIKTTITGIRKSIKMPDYNAIHQYSKKKLEISPAEDDITTKIIFVLGKDILSNISTSKGDSFYFAENIDSIAEIIEDII